MFVQRCVGGARLDDTAVVRDILSKYTTQIGAAKPTFTSIPAKEDVLRLLDNKITAQTHLIMAECGAHDSYINAYNFAMSCKVRDTTTPIPGVTLRVSEDDVVMRIPKLGPLPPVYHARPSASGVGFKASTSTEDEAMVEQ